MEQSKLDGPGFQFPSGTHEHDSFHRMLNSMEQSNAVVIDSIKILHVSIEYHTLYLPTSTAGSDPSSSYDLLPESMDAHLSAPPHVGTCIGDEAHGECIPFAARRQATCVSTSF